MCRYLLNPYLTESPDWDEMGYDSFNERDIAVFHNSIPGYKPTPVVSLPVLAVALGLKDIFVKDESHRFGLKAFKSMGASYAIYRFIKNEWEKRFGVEFKAENLYQRELLKEMNLPPFCTATDGNHGRAVAWFSKLIGQKAVIYLPAETVKARIDNIRNEGAEVVVVDGDYDEAVRRVAADAERNGWNIISDTSYAGYTHIPLWIMAGYTTMFREIDDVMRTVGGADFTHILIQSGVGSFAGAAAWYYRQGGRSPTLISVEPTAADCFHESILSGKGEPCRSRGDARTIMAGLNCATPSVIAWPLIRDRFTLFLALSDRHCRQAIRRYYHPEGNDPRIISGESGAAGLAALLALFSESSLARARQEIGLGRNSRVLVFNTEGDTDPVNFGQIIRGADG